MPWRNNFEAEFERERQKELQGCCAKFLEVSYALGEDKADLHVVRSQSAA